MLPKLGFSLQANYDRPMEQVIALLKSAGFSAVSPTWTTEENLAVIAACAQEQGMIIQTLHAPYVGIPALWQEDESLFADLFGRFIKCIEMCRQFHIPMLVVHGWQGHTYTFREPLYFENFDRIVSYARANSVVIAFENLEGEEYLAALMKRYPDMGFCWDSGHDRCYPHKMDFLKEYGHRLIMTHLNDNLGAGDPSVPVSSALDKHYLPFDGNLNWDTCIQRLKTAKNQEILNFEFKIKPNDRYAHLPLEDFVTLAAARSTEIAKRYAGFL